MLNFSDLLTATGLGVTLHNVLRYVAVRLTKVATDVQAGNVPEIVQDVKDVVDFVEKVDPQLVDAARDEVAKLKAEAMAEVDRIRQASADELRKLAEAVEHAAGMTDQTG